MKKIITIIFLLIILLLFITHYTNAVENQSIELILKSEKEEYKIGEEIFLDVYINKIEGFSGINLFIARKVYNNECVEYIETIANENWQISGDADKILLRKIKGEDFSKGKLCTLRFKALKNINTIIQLSEIDASGDEGYVYYEDGNVNEPSVEIRFSETNQTTSEGKNYTGIVLIIAGVAGLIGVATHYMLNKNKK